MIDGIREPVSGSLLYGNNISAPRSCFFGANSHRTAPNVLTTLTLGEQVTEMPEMAFTDNSMVRKRYGGTATKLLTGTQVESLWKKLHCLKSYLLQLLVYSPAQNLRDISFYPRVGGNTSRLTQSHTLMMCVREGAGSASPFQKEVNSNGIPKEKMPIVLYFGLRRRNRTQGSSCNSRTHSGATVSQDDGGLVIPSRGSSGGSSGSSGDTDLERGLGKTGKVKSDEPGMGSKSLEDEFYNPSEESVKALIERWKVIEKRARGIKIPPRFIKLVNTCNKNPNCFVDDIYQLLYKSDVYDLAYSQIKSNPGNMTPGSDGSTLDGWDQKIIDSIIAKMKDESFKFTPARVVEIPKQDGSMRKLKVAPPKDKIVQRILAWILEAIYEPSFADESFGFRPNLGCHDALKHIELKYNGARWFIEGDISKCFDEIDHSLLLEILRRRIKDERFIRLIAKALKAGYLNQFSIPQDCLIGTPQGSIVSPILCNIFMNEFDRFVLDKLKPKFTSGNVRAQPPEYKSLVARANYYGKQYKKHGRAEDLTKSIELRKQFQSMPSIVNNDPNFKRLVYCRYADDWLIGFAGSYTEAVEIRDLAKDFLSSMKLRLNMDKTLITKACEGGTFLGVRIHVPQNQLRFRQKGSNRKQRATLGVRLNAPIAHIYKKLSQAGYCTLDGKKSLPRFALYVCEKDEMVKFYNTVLRGIFNYYSCCDNYRRMSGSIFYTLRSSLCKVLAAKYKLKTVRATLRKYGKLLNKQGNTPLLNYQDKSLRGKPFKLGGASEPRLLGLFRKASYTIRAGALCIL
jgi:group II intron reverse transcriptase/maturase